MFDWILNKPLNEKTIKVEVNDCSKIWYSGFCRKLAFIRSQGSKLGTINDPNIFFSKFFQVFKSAMKVEDLVCSKL